MRFHSARSVLIIGFLSLAAGLSGCAEIKLGATGIKSAQRGSDDGTRGTYKVGTPYQINGVWYYPAEDYGYSETGIASFYGGEAKGVNFHGRYTANGELYDMNALTAAHQTLPMPSLVRVTNLENGRQLVLRINDRGPFVQGRIIDVSRRGAQLLGYELQGTARVRVDILSEESRQLKARLMGQGASPVLASAEAATAAPRTTVTSDALPAPGGSTTTAPSGGNRLPSPADALPTGTTGPAGTTGANGRGATPRGEMVLPRPAPPPVALAAASPGVTQTGVKATSLWIQAGAFSSYDNASRLSSRLERFGTPQISTINAGAQRLYRVRMGPVSSVSAADQLLSTVSAVAPGARITVE